VARRQPASGGPAIIRAGFAMRAPDAGSQLRAGALRLFARHDARADATPGHVSRAKSATAPLLSLP